MSSQPPPTPEPDRHDESGGTGSNGPHPQHRDAESDLSHAKETLQRLRRGMPYRRALWGYRLYYIGVMSSVGACAVGVFREEGQDPSMVVIPFALPLGVLGYLFAYLQLRRDMRDYLAESSPKVWHARRDRKNLFQAAIFRDAFMGRLRD